MNEADVVEGLGPSGHGELAHLVVVRVLVSLCLAFVRGVGKNFSHARLLVTLALTNLLLFLTW